MKRRQSSPTGQPHPPLAVPTGGWPDAASLAALRAWYEGLSSHDAVYRYLSSAGASGQSSRTVIGAIRRQLADVARSRHRGDLAALLTGPARERKKCARAVSRAIELLPSLPLPEPLIGDDIAIWLEPRAAAALQAQGIKTLAALTVRIPRRRRWWAAISDLGATGARKIEAFFAAHPQLTERARALIAVDEPQDIVPWERLAVPQEVDGSRGAFRAPEGAWRTADDGARHRARLRRGRMVHDPHRRRRPGRVLRLGSARRAAPALRARLAYATGLRANELAQATLGMIEDDAHGDRWLHLMGKGSKPGKVALPPLARSALDRYLVQRRLPTTRDRWDPRTPLLGSLARDSVKGITAPRLWNVMKRFFLQTADLVQEHSPGVADKVRRASPHWMRHTHATHALERGADLTTVRDNLRHSSVSTTSIYLHTDEAKRARQLGAAFAERRR